VERVPLLDPSVPAQIRRVLRDPAALAATETICADILTGSFQYDANWLEPGWSTLSDEERDAYLQGQAQRMAPDLLAFLVWWFSTKLEMVDDWRAGDQ
jgi:hypothetical protein